MQDFFPDRKVLCSIKGKSSEYMVFKRKGKSNSRFTENYLYEVLLDDATALVCGDLVTDTSTNDYFVISRRNGYFSKIAQLQRTNCTIDVYSVTGSLSSGYKSSSVSTDNPCAQSTVTASMRQYDAGLLDTTVKKLILPQITLALNHRIVLNSKKYCVTAIDDGTYEGLYVVQVKDDTR